MKLMNKFKEILKKLCPPFLWDFLKKSSKSDQILLDSRRIHQILFYEEIISKIRKLDGCIVECGVGYGRSAFIIAEIIQIYRKNVDFYLFDTFSGFPMLETRDKEVKNIYEGYYNAPLEDVKKFFFNSKISQNINIIFNKGDIKKKLVNFNSKISLLHLDLDILSSYDFALGKLVNNIQKGGIIIIDEYDSKKWFNIKECVDHHLKKEDFEKVISKFSLFNRVYFIKKY